MVLLWTITRKELLHGLLAFRFAAALLVMMLLWGVSLWTFGQDLRQRMAAQKLSHQTEEQQRRMIPHAWAARGLGMSDAVPPQPLSLFARGLEEEMTGTWRFTGEVTSMPYRGVTRVGAGPFYENPARTLFAVPDPQTILRLVGSLLALLFTTDALTREREQGTLALCLAQPVPRDLLLLGKLVGTWVLLVLASLVAEVGALTAVFPVIGVQFTSGEWLRLAALAGIGALYLLAFCGIGLALSAWLRETGTALLAGLAVWVLLVMVGAGLARAVGEQARPMESPVQLEGRKIALAVSADQRISTQFQFHVNGTWDPKEYEIHYRRRQTAREQAESELASQFSRFDQDYLPALEDQEGLVRQLARWSPSACFLHLAQGLAGTGGSDAQRLRRVLRRHLQRMDEYWREKAARLGWEGPVEATGWEDAPRLVLPAWTWTQWLADGLVDLVLLALWTVAAFLAAFRGFRRMSLVAE